MFSLPTYTHTHTHARTHTRPLFVTDLQMDKTSVKPVDERNIYFQSSASFYASGLGANRLAPQFKATDQFMFIEGSSDVVNQRGDVTTSAGPKGCPIGAWTDDASTWKTNASNVELVDISAGNGGRGVGLTFNFGAIGFQKMDSKANKRYRLCFRQNHGVGRSGSSEWDNLAMDLTFAIGFLFVTDIDIFVYHTSSHRSKQFITQRIMDSKMRLASNMTRHGATFLATDQLLFVADNIDCPNKWGAKNTFGKLVDIWGAGRGTNQSTAVAIGQVRLRHIEERESCVCELGAVECHWGCF